MLSLLPLIWLFGGFLYFKLNIRIIFWFGEEIFLSHFRYPIFIILQHWGVVSLDDATVACFHIVCGTLLSYKGLLSLFSHFFWFLVSLCDSFWWAKYTNFVFLTPLCEETSPSGIAMFDSSLRVHCKRNTWLFHSVPHKVRNSNTRVVVGKF